MAPSLVNMHLEEESPILIPIMWILEWGASELTTFELHTSLSVFFPPLQIERATFKGNSCNTAISVAPVSKYNPLFISHSNPIPAPPKVLPLMLQRVLDSHWRGKLSSRSPFSCPVKKKKILHANQISNISRNKKKKCHFPHLLNLRYAITESMAVTTRHDPY